MKITRVTIEAQWTCCDCHKVLPLEAHAETTEAAELKLHEELESEGFIDGRCHDCAEKHFLNTDQTMNTPTLSCPLEIQLLLDAYCFPTRLGNGSPAAEKAIRKLAELGAIQPQPGDELGRYNTTELGYRWIAALQSVPCPSTNRTMNTPTIKISITGPQGSGKTQIAGYLAQLISEHPFKTNGVPTPLLEIIDAGVPIGVYCIESPPAEVSELEALRSWKIMATKLIAEVPFQEIGEEMGLPLGKDVGLEILPYIRRLKSVISGIGNLVNAARLNQ